MSDHIESDELVPAEAERLDRQLESLFATVRPNPALDDAVIQRLRTTTIRRSILTGSWGRTLATGLAASVGLGITGVAVSQFAKLDHLPFPGSASLAMRTLTDERPTVLVNNGTDGSTDFSPPNISLGANVALGLEPELPSAVDVNNLSDFSVDKSLNAMRRGESQHAAFGTTWADNSRKETDSKRLGDSEKLLVQVRPSDGPAGSPMGGSPMGGPRSKGTDGTTTWEYTNNGTPVIPNLGVPVAPNSGHNFRYYFADPTKFHILPAIQTNEARDKKSDSPQLDGLNIESKTRLFSDGGAPAAKDSSPSQAPKVDDHFGERFLAEKGELARRPAEPTGATGVTGVTAAGTTVTPATALAAKALARKVIRSGDIEFEIDSFDPAVATVTKLVAAIPGAFIATVNSDKLPNGKVKGAIVLRVPPDQLDTLILDLRRELGKIGELKGQRIGSQDITKQYTDLESRLRAAQTMETRLLQIIKDGKGEIKQLLEAEKELGVWRTKIEEYEGELRYYGNMVSLSTLTVTLTEKDIRAAAGITQNDRVQAGVEVEDVEKSMQDMMTAVTEVKGRITKSELKQLAAGQFSAALHFEVTPPADGPLRDRLRQLGRVARLEVDRVQTPEGGTVQKDAKITRGDTWFQVQFYNLANIAPRETITLQAAVADVPASYQSLRDVVNQVKGRVLTAQLNEQDRQNVSAQLHFEVRRTDVAAIDAAIAAAGDVVSRSNARSPESDSVTDSKVLYQTSWIGVTQLRPRETTSLGLEVADVDGTAAVFGAQVFEAKGRLLQSQTKQEPNGRASARLVYEVPLTAALALTEKFKTSGKVRMQQSVRDPSATDGRYATARLDIVLTNADQIVPKDEGISEQVRKGLSYSVSVLLMSVTWVVFGLCVVLPWLLVGYIGYRLFRRPASTVTPPAPPTTT